MLLKNLCGVLAFVPTLVHSLGLTNSIQDADSAQSGLSSFVSTLSSTSSGSAPSSTFSLSSSSASNSDPVLSSTLLSSSSESASSSPLSLSSSLTSSPDSVLSSTLSSTRTFTLSLSVSSTSTIPVYSPTSSKVGNYVPLGCFAEPATGKIFPVEFADDNMSLEECNSYCGGKYQYFGLEYGRECWCGSSLSLATIAPPTDCYETCTGNGYEICGAPNRINIYNSTIPVPTPPTPNAPATIGAYHSIGCYTEGTNQLRALNGASFYDYVGMTDEACAVNCAGYTYWGTEYGGECYCGNTIDNGAIPAPSNACDMACSGNSRELCGSSLHLNVYSNKPILKSTSASSTHATLAPFTTVGCFADAKGKLKKLAAVTPMNSAACQSLVAAALTAKKPTTYHYFALENGKTCLGATTQPTPVMTSMVGAKACTVPCSGAGKGVIGTETCGGVKMYNLFANVSPTITGNVVVATA